jgi:hypothetical protein
LAELLGRAQRLSSAQTEEDEPMWSAPIIAIASLVAGSLCAAQPPDSAGQGSIPQDDAESAYRASPFGALSEDYFSRFTRDPDARPAADETPISGDWRILVAAGDGPLVRLMAGHLAQFLESRMGVQLAVEEVASSQLTGGPRNAIVLRGSGGGAPGVAGSFTLTVRPGAVLVQGTDAAGLRDGVVRLVDQMGLRQAPFLTLGTATHKPRIGLRCGVVPWLGSYRDAVFMGCNAVILTEVPGDPGGVSTELYALSTSDAIPELVQFRRPEALERLSRQAAEARRYGLKTFCVLRRWKAFPADAPIFTNHPETRGAAIRYGWYANAPAAGHIPCTEAPLVRQYLSETVRGLVETLKLDGVCAIVGGEEFEHCFMRPAGAEKGHTNCSRCEALGAETVVANLCNTLAQAARQANPEALFVAWPYSAQYVWSADANQAGLIGKLQPGTALLTEIEKDEVVTKPNGITKALWDYSIDLPGPGRRALSQIEACRHQGIPVYLKSEPELAFEAPGLPEIPCMDLWLGRANALAASGADGAWVFPFFRQCYGTTSAEVYKFGWWEPLADPAALLPRLAARIAGNAAGPRLREAWRLVSEAIGFTPELPPYYAGPYYLGPAHPMLADPEAGAPAGFPAPNPEGPVLPSARGDVETWGNCYRQMQEHLGEAVAELALAEPLVPDRCRSTFLAEALPTRWLYHTARTHANFYESCRLRDRLHALAAEPGLSPAERAEAQQMLLRWREVLLDEKANATDALPIMQADVRLDFHYHSHTALPHGADLIRAKLSALEKEITLYLPALAARCGVSEAGL